MGGVGVATSACDTSLCIAVVFESACLVVAAFSFDFFTDFLVVFLAVLVVCFTGFFFEVDFEAADFKAAVLEAVVFETGFLEAVALEEDLDEVAFVFFVSEDLFVFLGFDFEVVAILSFYKAVLYERNQIMCIAKGTSLLFAKRRIVSLLAHHHTPSTKDSPCIVPGETHLLARWCRCRSVLPAQKLPALPI